MNRLILLFLAVLFTLSRCKSGSSDGIIMTVNGPVQAGEIGTALTHEHILVDFIGADSISRNRWDRTKVAEKVLPFLKEVKELGCRTIVECTPAYLGRDPLLLKSLSTASGLNIITNTGYYGAAGDKYIPEEAFSLTADQLASKWIEEWNSGIDETGIKPGFIKIGVDGGSLSDIDRKLVEAAAKTHLQTGLTIASHTGPAIPAFEQLEVLRQQGVTPEAFIWVHAQGERDLSNHVKAAGMGAWVGFDGLSDNNTDEYVKMIKNMRENKLLGSVLLSHDAGWYRPGEVNGGDFRGYATLFLKLVPLLTKEGFSNSEINQLLITNPAKAYTIKIHRLTGLNK